MQPELIARAQRGDHEAFAALVRSSAPRIHAIARLILRDPYHAEDAVQEVFVLAWRHLRALREPGAWEAWLYRLTVRACYRLARSRRDREVVELQVEPPDEVGAGDFTRELAERDRVGRALARLPVEQRAVMVLHFFVGMPLVEAAAILEVPVGTAKSRLHRGLETLRTSLGPDRPNLELSAEPQR